MLQWYSGFAKVDVFDLYQRLLALYKMLFADGRLSWEEFLKLITFPWNFPINDDRDDPRKYPGEVMKIKCKGDPCRVIACIDGINMLLKLGLIKLPPYFIFGPNSNTVASIYLNQCGCSARLGWRMPGFNLAKWKWLFDLVRNLFVPPPAVN